jgi:hypothetical protein
VQRIAILWGLATATIAIASSLSGGSLPPRPDSSQAELAKLGQEYDDLQQWAAAIAATADTLTSQDTERSRVLADQLAHLIRPLEGDFERTTAALTTAQLETVLPLWERMAFAHAGLVMLQEQAVSLGKDSTLEPVALEDLANELSAVLEFAADVQQKVIERLTTPAATPIRAI